MWQCKRVMMFTVWRSSSLMFKESLPRVDSRLHRLRPFTSGICTVQYIAGDYQLFVCDAEIMRC